MYINQSVKNFLKIFILIYYLIRVIISFFYVKLDNLCYIVFERKETIKKNINNIKCLSFQGAGFYCFYYLGIYKKLFEYEQNNNIQILNTTKIIGISSGTWISTIIIAKINPDYAFNVILDFLQHKINNNKDIPFTNKYYMGDILDKMFFNFIDDRLIYCNNINDPCYHYHNNITKRLSISYTTFEKIIPENNMVENISCEESLYKYLYYSSHLPLITSKDLFNDNYYFDGGISVYKLYHPNYKDNETLFIGSYDAYYFDLKPSKKLSLFNMFFFNNNILELAQQLYLDGYNDTGFYFNL